MSENEFLEIIAMRNQMAEGILLDAAGADNKFETDQPITDTPTLSFELSDPTIKRFQLTEITYYMLPDNAVTYALALFTASEAVDTTSFSKLIYESPAAQAKGVRYLRCNSEDKLPREVNLDVPGIVWYSLDWSAAPGNCPGFIRLRGRKLG